MIDTREAVILKLGTSEMLLRGFYEEDDLEDFVKEGNVVLFPITNGRNPDYPQPCAVPHPDTNLVVQPYFEYKGKWMTGGDMSSLAAVTLERYACNLEDYAEDRREVFLKEDPDDKEELQFINSLIEEAWAVREVHSFVGAELECSPMSKIKEMISRGLVDADSFPNL